MRSPLDVISWIEKRFPPNETQLAVERLNQATDHTGNYPGDPIVRCAAWASQADLKKLDEMIRLMKIDYRDVIVAGEYDVLERKLMKVRNHTEPMNAD